VERGGIIRAVDDYEVIAEELSTLGEKLRGLDERLAEVEKVNARLEDAALTTARALGEISRHWDAVYRSEWQSRRKTERLGSGRERGLRGLARRGSAGTHAIARREPLSTASSLSNGVLTISRDDYASSITSRTRASAVSESEPRALRYCQS
jgi:hypothetical protein